MKTRWLIILLLPLKALAQQPCAVDYFLNIYSGTQQTYISKVRSLPGDELIAAGTIVRDPNRGFIDGMVTKFTSQGTVLWSRRYAAPGFFTFHIADILPADNGDFIVAGYVVDSAGRANVFGVFIWGALMMIDKFGNVKWSKVLDQFDRQFEQTRITTILQTNDGEFIVPMQVMRQWPQTNSYKIMRVTKTGSVKWTTTMTNPEYITAINITEAMKQTSDGTVVISTIAYLYKPDPNYLKSVHYFFALDPTDGTRIWQRGYRIAENPISNPRVVTISELTNGNLVFFAGYANTLESAFPFSRKGLNMITDRNGIMQKMYTYETGDTPLYPTEVISNGDQHTVLMDIGTSAMIANISAEGNINWSRNYNVLPQEMSPASFVQSNFDYHVFLNPRNNYPAFRMAKTEEQGEIPCMESPKNLTSTEIPIYPPDQIDMPVHYSRRDDGYMTPSNFTSTSYNITGSEECRQTCCVDIVGNSNEVSICENETYTLPDNYIVSQSGQYYVSFTTAQQCDSLEFYNVTVHKNPNDLKITGQTCMEGVDSVVLQATKNFPEYNWMGSITTSDRFVARSPGTYWVSVVTDCGTKTDSIKIEEKCEKIIWMPTAFTPNGDNLNDVFRIPPQHHNKLVSFRIYNRWGELIFQTTDKNVGWNGTYKNKKAAPEVYVYYIVMETSQGEILTKKGTVSLLR